MQACLGTLIHDNERLYKQIHSDVRIKLWMCRLVFVDSEFYRLSSARKPESCPVSEETATKIMSLPMHPALTDENLKHIVEGVEKVSAHYLK